MAHDSSKVIASGIDDLVARLRQDGVEKGQQEAEQIIAAAHAEAERIRAEALQSAEDSLASNREIIARESRAAQEALKVAYRDLVLDMKSHLLERLADDVGQRVGKLIDEPAILERMIVEAVHKICGSLQVPEGETLEVILPPQAMGMDAIRRDPASAAQGQIAELAFALQGQLLRNGVTFSGGNENQRGISLHLVNEQITVDATEESITELLLTYLQPRFRAILDGIIH